MIKRLTSILLAATVVLVPGLASASNHDDKGFYIGAGAHLTGAEANLGQTFTNLTVRATRVGGLSSTGNSVTGGIATEVFPVFPLTVTSDEDSDVGYGVHVGYKFNKHFAVEVGYAILGEFTGNNSSVLPASFGSTDLITSAATVSIPLGNSTLVTKTALEVNALSGAVLGTYPLADNASVFGRLGYYTTDISEDLSFALTGASGLNVNGKLNLNKPLFDDASGLMYGAGLEVNFGRNRNILVRGEFNLFSDGLGEVEDITQFGLTASWKL